MPTPPPVYVAGPHGFTEAGRLWADRVLLPAVAAAGLEPLDPWAPSPAVERLLAALAAPAGPERTAALRDADDAVAAANLDLLDAAAGVLAVLDGADVDSGTAAEIGWAAARGLPVVGVRTDLRRTGDNDGVTVNLQVEHLLRRCGGAVLGDAGAAARLLAALLTG